MCRTFEIILCLLIVCSLTASLDIGSDCKTKTDQDGICKMYTDCPNLAKKFESRQKLMNDIVMCNNYGVICCPSISKTKCKDIEMYTQSYTRVGVSILNPQGTLIGLSKCKHKSVPLIVGGQEAKRYEFPHQALVGFKTAKDIEWGCGGSLVSEKYVLTAAHCIAKKSSDNQKYVKLGMLSRLQDDRDVSIYNVIECIKHPNYSPRTFNNDIALLKLDRDVEFSLYIYPICLPTRQHDDLKAVLSGLGTTGKDDAQSERLMKVVLEKFSHNECQEKIRLKKIDNSTMLCFGDHQERKDSCRGDSGGPLQISNDDESHCTYKIIGVVSFGALDCGTPGIPSVYANVYNYLSWIEGIVWKDEE